MRTYTIYTQCDHCGVYDRDVEWCALCRRPKQAGRNSQAIGAPGNPRKAAARPSWRGSPVGGRPAASRG